ncbi:hypothetical protein ACFE04_030859 [Oxalis oulophora]
MSKKKLTLTSLTVDLGCSSCRRLHITNIFKKSKRYFSSSSGSSSSATTGTSSSYYDTGNSNFGSSSELMNETPVRGFGRVGGESLAVEKDSDDPYLDFRYSMLQMILEKEIYSREELKELLNVFLELNAPFYHSVIVRAFTEIWNGVFSVRNSNSNNNHSWL